MAEEELTQEGEEEALTGAEEDGQETPNEGEEQQGSEASDEDRIAESLASELGWSPKDKWRGAEEDWKPARDFLKTTVEVNKARGREIKSLNERVERIARTSTAMAERAAAEERAKWQERHQQAVEENDPKAALEASQHIQRLSAPQVEAPVQDFASRNASWFNVDPLATQMAMNVAQIHANKGADAATQVEEAEKAIRKRFPEYFEDEKPAQQPAKKPGASVPDSRSAAPAKSRTKGFADLPPEAKDAALDFEKRGRAKKEDYAKVYWQENA